MFYSCCMLLICGGLGFPEQSQEEFQLVCRFSIAKYSLKDLQQYAVELEKSATEKKTKDTLEGYIRILKRMEQTREKNEKDEVKSLILGLRDESEFASFIVSKDPKSPAFKLTVLGKKAIPNLIDAIDNDDLTRSVYWPPSINLDPIGPGHVLRVGDCAKGLLVNITGQEYGDRFIHAPAAKASPREVQAMYRKWWDSKKGKK